MDRVFIFEGLPPGHPWGRRMKRQMLIYSAPLSLSSMTWMRGEREPVVEWSWRGNGGMRFPSILLSPAGLALGKGSGAPPPR